MRIALGQLNPTVGDVDGNVDRLLEALARLKGGADLLVTPELYICGYPPRDLLEKKGFLERVSQGLARLVEASARFPSTAILVGTPTPSDRERGLSVYNSAVLIENGSVIATVRKSLLPSYDVFDETRYFDRADATSVVEFRGKRLGILVCEDVWNDPSFWPKSPYTRDPVAELAADGAELLVNLSASPFNAGKDGTRFGLLRAHCRRHGLSMYYVNEVGGNDELVFDGRSMVVDARGDLVRCLAPFEESVEVVDTDLTGDGREYEVQERVEAIHGALVLGVRDYLRKCGFTKAVLGLSGGIDSAVVAALAAEALGPENVMGVTMPSKYNVSESAEYSERLAGNLGIEFRSIPIEPMYDVFADVFTREFELDADEGLAFENIQARIRGNILMAISNQYGHLVLTTGNKSEMAVGYCTLYGDMCGGLAPIADVPKTVVFELARYMNRDGEVIPEWIINRPPSAELRPDQKDQDTLPPYEDLDRILVAYVEEGRSASQMSDIGVDQGAIDWVICAVNRNEYKRRQAAPGLRVTSKAFGVGRRIPIAARCEA